MKDIISSFVKKDLIQELLENKIVKEENKLGTLYIWCF